MFSLNKLLLYHPRIWISATGGAVVFFFLPAGWSTISRVLIGWNCGVDLFLLLIYFLMPSVSAE
jgi:uncharacterized membrane protein